MTGRGANLDSQVDFGVTEQRELGTVRNRFQQSRWDLAIQDL